MDRRKSIKALFVGTVSTGVLVEACNTEEKKAPEVKPEGKADDPNASGINRMKEEAEHEKEVRSKTFFTPDEMATITILGDIIIPKDEVSGSASDAKVPEFIEFIVKDFPKHQTPLRGGLRWLDMQCLKRYEKSFVDCEHQQQMEIVDDIAYPAIEYTDEKGNKVKKGIVKQGMEPGVAFFDLMRNLTATGFYTSEIG